MNGSHRQTTHNRVFAFVLLLGVTVLAGCGDDGKYKVSGSVTYKGEPVPSGEIRFTPDVGNTGPMVLVKIRDGQYETPKDKGLLGGAYQLTISGFGKAGNSKDPTAPDFGKPLFKSFREDVEFPKEDYVHDIVVEK